MRRIYTIKNTNGDVYGVPANVIADNYAKYYESVGEDYQENYEEVIKWFDRHCFVFEDWARNNMDWNDVKEHAFILESNKIGDDLQEMWVNGECEYRVVED